ncbi:hypothetical protein GCM10023063_38640 [Arthrobacter methylotrophus]
MIRKPPKPVAKMLTKRRRRATMPVQMVEVGRRKRPGGVWFDKEDPHFRYQSACAAVTGAVKRTNGNPSI